MSLVLLVLGCVADVPVAASPVAINRDEGLLPVAATSRDTGPCAAPLQIVFDDLPTDPVACGETTRAMRVVLFNTSNCPVELRGVRLSVDVFDVPADTVFQYASFVFDDGSMLGSPTPFASDASVTFSGVRGMSPHEALFASFWTTLLEDCGGTDPEEFTSIFLSDQVDANRGDGSLVTWIVPMADIEGNTVTVE